MKQAAVHLVRSRLGDDIDDAARGSAKFRIRARRNDLKFLDRFERDVDRGTLAAVLLAEKAVIVIAAVETHVVKNTALTGKVDLIAVRPLRDRNSGGQGQKVFKLSAQNRRVADSGL